MTGVAPVGVMAAMLLLAMKVAQDSGVMWPPTAAGAGLCCHCVTCVESEGVGDPLSWDWALSTAAAMLATSEKVVRWLCATPVLSAALIVLALVLV